MIWVLEHRRDLEADFRAFYHLSPKQSLALPGPEFLSLATRTTAFSGVMAARAAKIQENKSRSPVGNGDRREHEGTAALTTVPSLASQIEYATTPRR